MLTPGLPGLTPGFLIHYKGKFDFLFCPITKDGNKINNSLSWSEKILVNNKQENCILLFIEPLDLTKETALAVLPSVTMWDDAKKEFKETGKIQGGIFLTGSGKLIWISHYDLPELLKK